MGRCRISRQTGVAGAVAVVSLVVVLMLAAAAPAVAMGTGETPPPDPPPSNESPVISGTVADSEGTALSGITVKAYDRIDGSIIETVTGVDGGYEFTPDGGLSASKYKVFALGGDAYADSYYQDAFTPGGSAVVDVRYEDAADIDLTMEPARTISGTVTGGTGLPVEGVKVKAYRYESGEYVHTVTGGDGTYNFDAMRLPPGTYKVYVWGGDRYETVYWDGASSPEGATPVDLTAGDAEGIDFTVEEKVCFKDLDQPVLDPYKIPMEKVGKISDGYSDGYWRPFAKMLRRQFVKMALPAMGLPTCTPDKPSFGDVPPSDLFYIYVEGAKKAGLVEGFSDGTFGFDSGVTREQAAAIIARHIAQKMGKDLDAYYTPEKIAAILGPYGDAASVAPGLRAELAFAIQLGILKGTADSKLEAHDQLSRIQGAAMLIRAETAG